MYCSAAAQVSLMRPARETSAEASFCGDLDLSLIIAGKLPADTIVNFRDTIDPARDVPRGNVSLIGLTLHRHAVRFAVVAFTLLPAFFLRHFFLPSVNRRAWSRLPSSKAVLDPPPRSEHGVIRCLSRALSWPPRPVSPRAAP